jgi:RND family efflux transporter MFP subunit
MKIHQRAVQVLRRVLQILLPLAVLALGGLIAFTIFANRQRPVIEKRPEVGPLVRVVTATASSERLDVTTRGSVEPLRTIELAAEVGGRIVAAHPSLRAGGTFTENDVLVEIDPTDYRLVIADYEAAVARAELRLMQEQAEAEAALRAWQQLEGERPADPLVLRQPQIRDAKAALASAKAQLQRGHIDLERTKVMLPFAGRVRSVDADVGQTVQRGQRLAVVLDTSMVEVRLPVPLEHAAFVDLPLLGSTDNGPEVVLSAVFAGSRREWRGRIVRTESELDRSTRQLTVVARVAQRAADGAGNEAQNGADAAGTPLLVGMFVDARIVGNEVDGIVALPRSAMLDDDHVLIVRLEPVGLFTWLPTLRPTLYHREVVVLRAGRDRVVLRHGVEPGEWICVSSLDAVVDGMAVRIASIDANAGEERR